MKYDKRLLIDMIKIYAVVALVPTVGLATYVEPKFWLAIYPVVLVALLAVSLMINFLLEQLGWPKPPPVRTVRRKSPAKKKRK